MTPWLVLIAAGVAWKGLRKVRARRKVPPGFYLRESIRRRVEALASVFGVEVLTYAAMSNHLHLTLGYRPDAVALSSDERVAIR